MKSSRSIEESLLFICQWIIVVKPAVTIEFSKLHTDFVAILRRESGKFFEDFSLAHDVDSSICGE